MTAEEWLYLDRIEELLDQPLPAMRGSQCPPLSRFLRAAWKPEDLAHVRDCPHCQRATIAAWRVDCPSPAEVIRFALDPESSPLAAVWSVHLRQHLCPRCRPIVKWAARLGALREAAAAYFPLPAWSPAIASASSSKQPISAAETLAGGWRVQLTETAQGLVVGLEAPASHGGRVVRVLIAGADAVIEATIHLQPSGERLAGESKALPEWAGVLGTGCTILVEPGE